MTGTPAIGETPNSAILIADEVGQILDGPLPDREKLSQAVRCLKRALNVDVCTLYRVDRRTGDLFIEGAEGLAKNMIGERALRKNEGLTGLVVAQRKPLPVRDGPSHPNFQYVPGMGEEAFHSFLGAPLLTHGKAIGALVVQTRQPRDFTREEVALLSHIARHIGGAFGEVFAQLNRPAAGPASSEPPTSHAAAAVGRALAPGWFLGPPVVLDHSLDLETVATPPSRGVDTEIRALRLANRKVSADLEREAKAISGTEGHAILIAHKVLLEDSELAKESLDRIRAGDSASESIRKVALRWIDRLQSIADPNFAARAVDFRDIANRLMHALGIEAAQPRIGRAKFAALARVILPGDILRLGPERLGALVMTDQGIYSHTAILARSFNIPAVQIDRKWIDELAHAKEVFVDGAEGAIYANPTPAFVKDRIQRIEVALHLPHGGPADLAGPTETRDGLPVRIGVNAGLLNDLEGVDGYGPDEIGLYRTEIPFMSRETLPGYKGQLAHYRRVMHLARGRHVIFRTFDFGGDKIPASLRFEREENPMMGQRSTRLMLERPDLFRTQLRALLTVSAEGPMSILMPMISTPEELNLALDELNTVRMSLDRAGLPHNPNVKIGVMLEVPSVLFQLDELSRDADFFCVGSNDLIQYLMAADRSNPRVAHLHQWHHPAALVALDRLLRHCNRNSRPVSLCGEMAAHPWAAILLVGMGYTSLSVDQRSIPQIKWTLRQVCVDDARKLAHRAMRATSSTEVVEILYSALDRFRADAPPLAKLLNESLDRLRAHSIW